MGGKKCGKRVRVKKEERKEERGRVRGRVNGISRISFLTILSPSSTSLK